MQESIEYTKHIGLSAYIESTKEAYFMGPTKKSLTVLQQCLNFAPLSALMKTQAQALSEINNYPYHSTITLGGKMKDRHPHFLSHHKNIICNML